MNRLRLGKPLIHCVNNEFSQTLITAQADHVSGRNITQQRIARPKPGSGFIHVTVECLSHPISGVGYFF